MSATGRPEREYRSAQHEGTPVCAGQMPIGRWSENSGIGSSPSIFATQVCASQAGGLTMALVGARAT